MKYQESVNLFPVSLYLLRKPCLIIGGGKIAERKLIKLLQAGAKVTVICPEPSIFISEQFNLHMINLYNREFIKNDTKVSILFLLRLIILKLINKS